jgi:hypothetical protein
VRIDYMSIPTKHKPKSGFWKEEGNKVWWAETDCYGNVLELIDPLKLENIAREANLTLIFIKETSDPDSVNGKIKRFFAQDVHIRLRDDVSPNIVLRFDSKLWYISDLTMLGQTFLAPICGNSTEYLIIQRSEPYKITQAEAKEFMKTSGYAYGKVEQKSDGSLDYYVTV